MKKDLLPRFTVLAERVAGEKAPDLFALSFRLGPVLDVLRHRDTETPLAVALYGRPGAGKTTALRWIEERLLQWNRLPPAERKGHARVLPVWFHPREHEVPGRILPALVADIILQGLVLLDDGEETTRISRISSAAGLYGGMLGIGFLRGLELLARRWNVDESTGPLGEGEIPDNDALDIGLDVFHDLPTQWLRSLGTDDLRIAVFIDGIDHCRGETIIELFDVIGRQLQSTGVIFIVALESTRVRRTLRRHYAESGCGEEEIRSFLDGIFQLEVHIDPSPAQIRNYHRVQAERLDLLSGGAYGELLDPEQRSAIDEAILRLSNGNPRSIKQLLNSAIAGGTAAARSAADVASAKKLFAQGIQHYLLRRWLATTPAGEEAFYRNDVRRWLTALSEEAANPYSDYNWVRNRQMEEAGLETGTRPRRPLTAGADDPHAPPEGLSFRLLEEWVWNLLAIPFDPDAGAPATSEAEEFSETGDLLREASPALLTVLNEALGDEELSPANIRNLRELIIGDAPLSEEDFRLIGHLEKLEKLDLHNNGGVHTLDWIVGLKNLRRLNLACTPVKEITPLGRLKKLEHLDLSYTQVEDLAPLAPLTRLRTLILYGAPVRDLSPLAGLEHLEQLNLSRTLVTTEELRHLENLSALKKLFLQELQIDREAVIALKSKIGFELAVET